MFQRRWMIYCLGFGASLGVGSVGWAQENSVTVTWQDFPTPPLLQVPPYKLNTQEVRPLPNMPPIQIDTETANVGIGQKLAKDRNLQARILWIDGTANIGAVNSEEKIVALVKQIKSVGFNVIVFDVKPIVGFTLYPSKLTNKLLDWRGVTLPLNFDPLAVFVREARINGIQLIANMNVFSEGHSMFKAGPGYSTVPKQTVLYETTPIVRATGKDGGTNYVLNDQVNVLPTSDTQLGVFLEEGRVPRLPAASVAVVVDSSGKVLAQIDGASLNSIQVGVPQGGSMLVGTGRGSIFLKQWAAIGTTLNFDSLPNYIPISQKANPQIPLMMNPNDPENQQRALQFVNEIISNYQVDGIIFDDRLRYASINADFSEQTRKQFENYVGKTLKWPDDVMRYELSPDLSRRLVQGAQYDNWLLFRAQTLRNWVARASALVKSVRPSASVGVYVGSWYGQYPLYGSNWAGTNFNANFSFLTPSYQKTGYANLVDYVVTGCYYNVATLKEASDQGRPLGQTVEAAGVLSNRVVGDQTWVYAGIALDQFKEKETMKKCLEAAVATTQGVMVFDLSHNIQEYWSIFQEAFSQQRQAPHTVTGLTEQLRLQEAERASRRGIGEAIPPLTIYPGQVGIGL